MCALSVDAGRVYVVCGMCGVYIMVDVWDHIDNIFCGGREYNSIINSSFWFLLTVRLMI